MYRCKNCWHGVDTEDLNSIFQCPICGVEREMFEEIKITDKYKGIAIDKKNKAITRIIEKCINCGRCNNVCHNLVGIKYEIEQLRHPICVNCGTCILNCPTGAIVPKYAFKKVFNLIKNKNKTVIISVSPAVRVALGEEFGLDYGKNVEGKMVTALKKIGFDYVFDTTFGADLTVIEEANELIKRLDKPQKLPQFSSCCPSWVKYLEIYHPELIKHLSTCKSPIGMQGSIVKTYFAKEKKLKPQNIIHVALTPCTAKKAEIALNESNTSKKYYKKPSLVDTDYVITTSELGLMLRENNIDFANLSSSGFDNLLNKGSGSGLLFGNIGGVTNAVINTTYHLLTNEDPHKLDITFEKAKKYDDVLITKIVIKNKTIAIAVVNGLIAAEKIIQNNVYQQYDFIEVMNCQSGCIGGGGQPLGPINKQNIIIEARKKSLKAADKADIISYSYQNPDIIRIYNNFLEKPGSSLSEKLLHTTYKDKSKLLKNK
ncbi:MAG: [Fe-Fe] hydrogenase large subunit C-terminal domain-containing protein [Bacilli bacterium]